MPSLWHTDISYFLIILEKKLRPCPWFFFETLIFVGSFVEDVLLHAVLVLGEPQPDPGAVEALVKLCSIVPPPARHQTQPPGAALDRDIVCHQSMDDILLTSHLYPCVHEAALLAVDLQVDIEVHINF